MVDLDQLEENRRFLLGEALEAVAQEPSAEVYFDVVFHYRALGICKLLARADQRAFGICLAKSALARVAFLKSPQASGADSRLLCISHDLGLEAALAAGELATALTIVELSARERFADAEYPDSFLFHAGMHGLVRMVVGGESFDLAPVIAELEREASEDTAHLPLVLRALQNLDSAGFAEALGAGIDRRVARFEELATTPGFPKDVHTLEGSVWIEALALLRIAELRGLTPPGTFRMVPPLSRLPVAKAGQPAHAWLNPDA